MSLDCVKINQDIEIFEHQSDVDGLLNLLMELSSEKTKAEYFINEVKMALAIIRDFKCTGLKDKNGNNIYEGSVIKCTN